MRKIKILYCQMIFAALAVLISCSDNATTPEDTSPPRVVSTFPADSEEVKETFFVPYVAFSEPVVVQGEVVKVVETGQD